MGFRTGVSAGPGPTFVNVSPGGVSTGVGGGSGPAYWTASTGTGSSSGYGDTGPLTELVGTAIVWVVGYAIFAVFWALLIPFWVARYVVRRRRFNRIVRGQMEALEASYPGMSGAEALQAEWFSREELAEAERDLDGVSCDSREAYYARLIAKAQQYDEWLSIVPAVQRISDRRDRHYGFWNLAGDVVMTLLTYGLWLIWVYVR